MQPYDPVKVEAARQKARETMAAILRLPKPSSEVRSRQFETCARLMRADQSPRLRHDAEGNQNR